MSSAAIRLRHANAQPCFKPPTTDGSAAGITTCRKAPKPRAPSTRPARSRIGGTWSMPLMMPLAIDGAAPSTTTNVTVPGPSWNKMIASGTHATEGIVWRPVIIEPIAARSTLTRATAMPRTLPIRIASTKPWAPRRNVTQARGDHLSAVVPQLVEHRERRRHEVLGLPARPDHDLPHRDHDADREQLRPRGPPDRPRPGGRRAFDGRARAPGSRNQGQSRRPRATSSRSWSVIVAASVATSGESIRRGRGIVTL